MEQKKLYNLLLVIGVSFLGIASISIAVYFLFILPTQEASKLAWEIEQAKIEQEKEEEEKRAEEEKSNRLSIQRDLCISIAEENYRSTWALNCEDVAKITKNYNERAVANEKNCKASSLSGYDNSYCNATLLEYDDSPSCSLPTARAQPIESRLKDAKEECYKKYSE